MSLKLKGRVAIVTGAGAGLGRAHAHFLAHQGARVVVNDVGMAAQEVADEINAKGGEAIAFLGSVTDEEKITEMVSLTLERWGAVDILICNAGILRDRSFSKMTLDDFRAVFDVHLMGSVICTKAVWDVMRKQNYGRIVFTASSSGLYGNFGQANYASAKMALVGLMQTLALEGARNNVLVNCLAPTALTSMTDGLLDPEAKRVLRPEAVSAVLLSLVHDKAPTKSIVCAGGGNVARAYITLTPGIFIGDSEGAADQIIEDWVGISDRENEFLPASGLEQAQQELIAAFRQHTV